ncbi:MAG: DUF192 domain-containing protein [bacterium]
MPEKISNGMNFKNYVSFIIVILFLGVIMLFYSNQNIFLQKMTHDDIKFVKVAGQMIKVELALTAKDQEHGLSGRKILENNTGMLFVFSKPGEFYFWMKDMNFPIDIIWIGDDLRVIYIQKSVRPSSYPNSFGPGVDNRYVLEVSSGFSEKNNLKIGDSVEFLR